MAGFSMRDSDFGRLIGKAARALNLAQLRTPVPLRGNPNTGIYFRRSNLNARIDIGWLYDPTQACRQTSRNSARSIPDQKLPAGAAQLTPRSRHFVSNRSNGVPTRKRKPAYLRKRVKDTLNRRSELCVRQFPVSRFVRRSLISL